MSDQEKLAAFLNTCDKCDEASTHNFCDKHFVELEEPTIENRGLGSGIVGICTRPLPHLCAINGPWTPRASYDAMKAILDEAEWFESIDLPVFLPEWLQDRLENCLRLAMQKCGEDKREWLIDALYFKLAVDAVSSFYAEKLDGPDSQPIPEVTK